MVGLGNTVVVKGKGKGKGFVRRRTLSAMEVVVVEVVANWQMRGLAEKHMEPADWCYP